MDVQQFIGRWSASGGSERANKDSFLRDLCDVLGVPHPEPRVGDRARDRYVFEADAVVPHEGGSVTIGKIDLYKAGCFVLEAKQGSDAGAGSLGTARRGTPAWHIAMRDAFGQALGYARTLPQAPPFLIVVDIGHCFDLYATFDGTLEYRPFPDAQASRVFLTDLGKHTATLKQVWTDPFALDPAKQKARVTRTIAGHIAELSAALEDAGHAPELVAKFLMRALFTMFAEDVGLLPEALFTKLLRDRWCGEPEVFPGEVAELWSKMNTGGSLFGAGQILRFNGGLFADPKALPLSSAQLRTLLEAARCSWADVEPAIFGTLLERALNKRERHALGAHYTPREYVARLVKPTIEDPLRAEWDLVRVEARQLVGAGQIAEARTVVGEYHRQLCTLRVLDPACGTGNFLYVALDTFKRLESEVLALLDELGDTQAAFGLRVTPAQFLGIEVKPWAREIADLVLWLGFLSWNARITGKAAAREPVLESYGNIECRDAVLEWDRIEPVLDAEGRPATRWDGVSTKPHPVTGKEVPDEARTVPVERYVNPRPAAWPQADFIVGNPPFIGGWKIRQARGDGYVEALWSVYPTVPEKADYVMFWVEKAAAITRNKGAVRFGLITTNSIGQVFQRRVLAAHLDAEPALRIAFAVPDHPWVQESDGAAVRIAMTVGEAVDPALSEAAVLATVVAEGDEAADVQIAERRVGRIGADLRAGARVSDAIALRANDFVCSPGVQLYGAGFILDAAEARAFRAGDPSGTIIRPYLNGRDLAASSRGAFVIDFFGKTKEEAATAHPDAYQRVLLRVKPERDQNQRAAIRETWWRFGWERPKLRAALAGLPRYIATGETAKHRFFVFLDAAVLPDNKLWAFGLADGFALGVLSSRVHVTWALAAGGRMGVGNDPIYNKSTCFDPFPFPAPTDAQAATIRALGERLDAHRKARQAAHPDLTLTGMYNVLAKLRSGEALTDKEHVIHEHGLVSILREVHDALDAAVLDAYGWPHDLDDEGILSRLVALNAERAAEEKRGLVRWLRPDYQRPLAGQPAAETIALPGLEPRPVEPAPAVTAKWPASLSDRIAAVRSALDGSGDTLDVEQVARRFKGARRADVAEILASLTALGLAVCLDTTAGRCWRGTRASA